MTRTRPMLVVLAVLSIASALACRSGAPVTPPVTQPSGTPGRPTIIQPGAPGEASAPVSSPAAPVATGYTKADVAFMQGMIGHHAQALDMVRLLETRTANDGMKLLGLRIKVSQQDEIKSMQDWLRERGEAVPDEHAHHAHDYKLMPGMLSPDEMKKLEAATGVEFDRLFLEYMIKHHQGAIGMVEELYKHDRAGQEPAINAFATDVVADQQMEIDRMIAMLRGMQR